jgi:glycosyltransferase involved in cell wall biosynthesis
MAARGHEVHVVTNAPDVEPQFRLWHDEDDRARLDRGWAGAGGGSVTVHTPEPMAQRYIPWANPFVTRLAGLTADVVDRHRCELIFSYYLEPYGTSAHLASAWTGAPHAVTHAGSDVGHLIKNRDLGRCYREVIARADAVVTSGGGSPDSPRRRLFESCGVPADRLVLLPYRIVATDIFSPDLPPLDLGALAQRVRGVRSEHPISDAAKAAVDAMLDKPFDPHRPIVTIYGKVGATKGSLDLVAALSALQRRFDFQFVAVTAGHGAAFEELVGRVTATGLAARTWILPFIAQWKLAQLVRMSTAVCFLERRFGVQGHAPFVAREVLAAGSCLVCSREIIDKQRFADRIVDRDNAVVVADPANIDELAGALADLLSDPARAAGIAARGLALSRQVEIRGPYERGLERMFATCVQRGSARRAG